MLFGERYVVKDEIFSTPDLAEMTAPNKIHHPTVKLSSATPYPYPTRKVSKDVPPFRVRSVLKSMNVNPEPLIKTKTPMELHRARIRIAENEIGHSVNEASKKFFGSTFPIPIKHRSQPPAPPATGILRGPSTNKTRSFGKVAFETDVEVRDRDDEKPSKTKSFAVRQETYPAVVLLKTNPIAPLRLRSPLPRPRYGRSGLDPPRLEEINVVNGFTHLNTDGRTQKNSFAPVPPKKLYNRQDGRQRFHAEIDMSGFLEDEIFFQTDDSALLVIGLRERRDGLNARKVTEVLEFPEGIYPDSLCISRTPNGTLIMEQHF